MTARIPVADGWEGATWTTPSTATVKFWKYTAETKTWSEIGHSRYPVYARISCTPQIAGAVVDGANDPTYVVGGCFSGDGVLNTTAFANGPHGWGLVEQHGSQLVASGQAGDHNNGPSSALFYNEKINSGTLVVIRGNNTFFTDADEWRYPLRTSWHWAGSAYRKVHDNAFTARSAHSPSAKHPLPSSGCPKTGSYNVSIGLNDDALNNKKSEQPIRVVLFPPNDNYPSKPQRCHATLTPTTPIVISAGHTTAKGLFSHNAAITHRRWMTAPSWLLLDGDGMSPTPLYAGSVAAGLSPYVVPTSFGINEILSYLHPPTQPHYTRHLGGIARPDHGVATFSKGKLTALAISTTRALHPVADAHQLHRLKHRRHLR